MKKVIASIIIVLFVGLTIPDLSRGGDAFYGIASKGIVRIPHMGMVEKIFGAPRMHNMRSYWNSYKQFSLKRTSKKDLLEQRELTKSRLDKNVKRSGLVHPTPD